MSFKNGLVSWRKSCHSGATSCPCDVVWGTVSSQGLERKIWEDRLTHFFSLALYSHNHYLLPEFVNCQGWTGSVLRIHFSRAVAVPWFKKKNTFLYVLREIITINKSLKVPETLKSKLLRENKDISPVSPLSCDLFLKKNNLLHIFLADIFIQNKLANLGELYCTSYFP